MDVIRLVQEKISFVESGTAVLHNWAQGPRCMVCFPKKNNQDRGGLRDWVETHGEASTTSATRPVFSSRVTRDVFDVKAGIARLDYFPSSLSDGQRKSLRGRGDARRVRLVVSGIGGPAAQLYSSF